MPNYRHVVRLPFTSGLPEDIAVNVWHSDGTDEAEAVAFSTALITFYNAIDGLLSNQLSTTAGAATVTAYALADSEPRAPIDTQTFTITPNASTLPLEVALCLSFQGTRISGQPQARRRGRVYLGPLGGIQDSNTGRPSSANITTLVNAADALLTTSQGAGVAEWSVYSPTLDSTIPVDNGWIDNEFDTVRRRGRTRTSRTLFS